MKTTTKPRGRSAAKPQTSTSSKPKEVRVARSPLDWYETDPGDVWPVVPFLTPARTVLDIGCGRGPLGGVIRQAWPDARIFGVELDVGRANAARATGAYEHVWTGDALAPAFRVLVAHAFDLVLGNPAFSIWGSCVEVAIDAVAPGGEIAFLAPGTLIEGKPFSRVSDQLVIRWLTMHSDRWGRYDLRQRPRFTRIVKGVETKSGQDRMPYWWACYGERHAGVWKTLDRSEYLGIR
jgi:SAM-dependent methyltransferase